MPTSLSPVGISNLALAKVGSQAITSLLDQFSTSAIICNQCLEISVQEVARAGRWNFLLTPAQLTEVTQTPVQPNPASPITATPWAPLTAYTANQFISYGAYYYNVMFDVTSSTDFFNDLTAGYYTQTDQSICSSVPDPFVYSDGSQYLSSWPYAYALPADFQLLDTLNGQPCYAGWSSSSQQVAEFQIMGDVLYCNQAQAVVRYVRYEPDTTRYDSLFVDALTWNLASKISTTLRQDGGQMESVLIQQYDRSLRKARAKNGGEQNNRRFNPIATSTFNQARYRGLYGRIYIPGWLAKYL